MNDSHDQHDHKSFQRGRPTPPGESTHATGHGGDV